jgi:hypothetical protein
VIESLENVREQFDTDRHVLIGTTDDDAAAADAAGWEYLPVEQAADAAGWTVAGDDDPEDPFESSDRDDWP